ncbi:MAG: DMT family transporter [Roseivivax sp.]|nr:DMT family transporter [Roseivivax sp.]
MAEQNNTLGVWLMVAATFVFAMQDGLSRHLAEIYPIPMVVMLRYWFFALFVITLTARNSGGLRRAARSAYPLLQVFRGLLLVFEIWVTVLAFTLLGLVETHAVFACYPLLVAALSGPVLGEHVGWRRWTAIGIGFVGVLVILQPGTGVFSPLAALPLLASAMFALYGLLTRYVSRRDSAVTSFFYTGVTGAVAITGLGLWHWVPMAPVDWLWMGALCLTAVSSHWLLIQCYAVAEASAVQPFAYLQLPFASMVGVIAFGETIRTNVAAGAAIVVAAGLFTLWRARQKSIA